jgi:hypothetical protein
MEKIISGESVNYYPIESENCFCKDEYKGVSPITDTELSFYAEFIEIQNTDHSSDFDPSIILDTDFIEKLCSKCLDMVLTQGENAQKDYKKAKQEMFLARYKVYKKLDEFDENTTQADLDNFYNDHYKGSEYESIHNISDFLYLEPFCDCCEKIANKFNHNTDTKIQCHSSDEYITNLSESIAYGDMLLKLDIGNNTNDALVENFLRIVNKLRRLNGVPNKTKNQKEIHYLKGIIYNQVIPYLDLFLWKIYCYVEGKPLIKYENGDVLSFIFDCKFNDKRIVNYPHKLLSETLFKDLKDNNYTSSGGYYLKQIIPRYTNLSNLSSLQSYVNQEGMENTIVDNLKHYG